MTFTVKIPLLILLLLATIAGSGCKRGYPPSLPKLAPGATILAFGDSLTYGTGASVDHDYPSVLAQLTGMEVLNAGIPGEVSRDGLARLPALLDEYRPQLLLLIHGGNDMIRKFPRPITADNLRHMIAAAKQRNISVFIAGVPQPGLLLLDSADIYAQVAETEQIPSNLEILPEILANSALKSDVIHPNDAGYRKLAETIAQSLREAGAL